MRRYFFITCVALAVFSFRFHPWVNSGQESLQDGQHVGDFVPETELPIFPTDLNGPVYTDSRKRYMVISRPRELIVCTLAFPTTVARS